MDASRGFVTKLVDEGKLNEAKRSGITNEFLDENFVPVYSYIQRHYTDFKDVPSRDAVLKAFPNFEFGTYKEPLEYFIKLLKDNFKRAILEESLERVASIYTKDPGAAEQLIRDSLKQLQVTQKSFRDINVAQSALERVEEYEKRKTEAPEDGILSRWAKLDYQTLGFHPEEFIVVVGEKYMGKSWTMLYLAVQAARQGERVLFVTKEMSQRQIIRRHDALYASVCFDSLRRGELSNVEEQRYAEKMEELTNEPYHFMVAREGVNTIADIEQKAIEMDATIIFGDSIYLFLPDERNVFSGETHKRLEVSRACKTTATNLGIPFVVSVQAGRKKTKERIPDLDDIEWSNAFSQDAETVVFIHKDELDRELKRSHMYLLKSRDGDLTDFFINQDFIYMDFSQREDQSAPTTTIVFDEDENGIFQEE